MTIFLCGCSSGISLNGFKLSPSVLQLIKVETPNCPTSECKFSYENSGRNDYVNPPGSVQLPESDSTLYAICYERSGGKQERVRVPAKTTTLIHPIDCTPKEENVVNEVENDEDFIDETIAIETDDSNDSEVIVKIADDSESEVVVINEYDQKLLDQLQELLEQGLISDSTFEKEKENVLNKPQD